MMSGLHRPIVVIPLPGNEGIGQNIAIGLSAEIASPAIRRFPDEEAYLRLVLSIREFLE